MVRIAEGVPVVIDTGIEDGFKITPKKLSAAITDKTRLLFLNSPSNPTGSCYTRAELMALGEVLVRHPNIVVLADDIYEHIHWADEPFCSLATACPGLYDQVVTVNGVSKSYAMTGFRLGYVIAPKPFVRAMQKLQQNFFISANSVAQKAAVTALQDTDDDVQVMKQTYDKRRRYMIDRLKQMGFGITREPTGAFYVFANARHISVDSYRLAFDILDKAHVGVTPGIDFGTNGEGYIRFSYANSIENITEGLDRIEDYLAKNH